jgi:hypothetical protein
LPSPFPLPEGEGEDVWMKREVGFAHSYFLSLWERLSMKVVKFFFRKLFHAA